MEPDSFTESEVGRYCYLNI